QLSSSTGVQRNPSIYLNAAGSRAFVVWEDGRFANTLTGWGIFGIELALSGTTLSVATGWYADSANTDANGVAIVLKDFNYSVHDPILFPYNNNGNMLMFWLKETVTTTDTDLYYINPQSYMGGINYLPVWN
ncbi:MAG: hypothetical protein GXY14_03095, partial [Spirochaetes bacterium]|nr:hypothetical protein [Spirochaetota bacterium]